MLAWPPLEEALESTQVERDVVAALATGWYFGTVSMFGLGSIVLHQALRRLRGEPIEAGPLWIVATLYAVFGDAAYVASDLNPHFLFFIGAGVLVVLFAALGRSSSGRHADAG